MQNWIQLPESFVFWYFYSEVQLLKHLLFPGEVHVSVISYWILWDKNNFSPTHYLAKCSFSSPQLSDMCLFHACATFYVAAKSCDKNSCELLKIKHCIRWNQNEEIQVSLLFLYIYLYTHILSLIWYAMEVKKKALLRLSPVSVSVPGNVST